VLRRRRCRRRRQSHRPRQHRVGAYLLEWLVYVTLSLSLSLSLSLTLTLTLSFTLGVQRTDENLACKLIDRREWREDQRQQAHVRGDARACTLLGIANVTARSKGIGVEPALGVHAHLIVLLLGRELVEHRWLGSTERDDRRRLDQARAHVRRHLVRNVR